MQETIWHEVKKKLRDNDHLTRKYRGAAHNRFNIQYCIDSKRVKISCIKRDLKGYDANLILSAAKPHPGKIKFIPNNMEK